MGIQLSWDEMWKFVIHTDQVDYVVSQLELGNMLAKSTSTTQLEILNKAPPEVVSDMAKYIEENVFIELMKGILSCQ